MTLERDLAPDLERSLGHLPTVPATTYLATARKVRRRRRTIAGAATSVVLAGGLVLAPTLLDSSSPTPVASMAPGAGPGERLVAPEPDNPVTAVPGLEGVEHFTTEEIPGWVGEHGNNGPVDIAPDGRLWVAPGAEVHQTVVDPYAAGGPQEHGTSYAVEATYEGETRWVLLPGLMEPPGLWTDDFELWVDEATAFAQDRPSIGARLVQFADPGRDELVARDGAEVVRQVAGIDLGPETINHPKNTAAEVRWAGTTWFVLARIDGYGKAFYQAYDPATTGPDLDSFVTWLEDRG
jgi:hypothetical protein